jgi:alpha-L-arabinofuranosidase
MKTHGSTGLIAAAAIICGLTLVAGAQSLTMQVDAGKTGAPISKNLYGMFTEFLPNMYDGGLRAEMIGDRKFYYPITAPAQPAGGERGQPAAPGARGGRGGRASFNNPTSWSPIGPDGTVVMDRQLAYVGEHSPQVKLDAGTPRGIQQAGLALRNGKKYSGRVVLAVDPGAKVSVSLVWGANPTDRQTINIESPGKDYAKYPLTFTAGGDSDSGRLEIVGTGAGTFHVGAVSLMPADNVDGYRADMLKLFKDIGVTLFRWPGGNFVSGYDWRDGIGDPDKRPPRYDFAWNKVESNDMGIDDFMTLCKLLDIEPYMCVNDGYGDAFSAAQQVEYANGAASTPMGKLRAANGHPEPYKIKWWNVGNEMYGNWQLGHMSLKHYTIKHNQFVQAMRAVDPTITIVASGATPAEMTSTGAGNGITRQPVTAFGDAAADWDGGLLANSANYFDVIAEHLYPKATQAFDSEKQTFVNVTDSTTDQARRLSNRVRCVVEAWEEYQKRFPNLNMSKIPVSVDEWSTGMRGGEILSTISAAEALQEMFRHSDLFTVSGYTAMTSLLASNKTDVTIRPIGLMFKLYRRHFGTIPVAVTGNAPQHDVAGTVNVDKPKVPSGSDTYPLDVAAALTADRKALTVAVVNPTESAQDLNVTFTGASVQGKGRLWRIAPASLTAANEIGKPMALDIVESPITETPGRLTVPPISMSIYELELR